MYKGRATVPLDTGRFECIISFALGFMELTGRGE